MVLLCTFWKSDWYPPSVPSSIPSSQAIILRGRKVVISVPCGQIIPNHFFLLFDLMGLSGFGSREPGTSERTVSGRVVTALWFLSGPAEEDVAGRKLVCRVRVCSVHTAHGQCVFVNINTVNGLRFQFPAGSL